MKNDWFIQTVRYFFSEQDYFQSRERWGAIQGTFTTAVVSKSALNLFYDGKSPPGTIYYGKKSVREFFTTDWEVILQVKTCSKGPNLRQGKPPVVNIFYGGKRSKKGAKLRICSPAIFYFEFTAEYDGRWVYKPIFLFCYTGHSVHESIYQYVVVISVNSNVSVLFPICYLNLLHHFLAVMGRVIPNGQCARSMPLSTWLRPNAFKKKKNHRPCVDPRVLWPRSRDFERRFRLTPAMVEYLAGQFYNSSIYVTEGDDPDGKGHQIPLFQKVLVLFAYISYYGYCKSINYMNRCIILSVVKTKKRKNVSITLALYLLNASLNSR